MAFAAGFTELGSGAGGPTGYLATLAPAVRAGLEADVRALVEPLGSSFDLPYVTYAWAFHRN